jgi:hypothetical protein
MEPHPIAFLPKVTGPIGASGTEGAVRRMKGDGGDGECIVSITMALERKVERRILFINVLFREYVRYECDCMK